MYEWMDLGLDNGFGLGIIILQLHIAHVYLNYYTINLKQLPPVC